MPGAAVTDSCARSVKWRTKSSTRAICSARTVLWQTYLGTSLTSRLRRRKKPPVFTRSHPTLSLNHHKLQRSHSVAMTRVVQWKVADKPFTLPDSIEQVPIGSFCHRQSI